MTNRKTGYYVVRRLYRETEVAYYDSDKRHWLFIGDDTPLKTDPLTVVSQLEI